MPASKDQHFVPQFYLRNFARSGEQCIRAFVIERRQHIPRASIKGQCHGPYLYGAEPRHEPALTWMEGQVAPVIRRMIDFEDVPAAETADSEMLHVFVSVQRGRTPAAASLRRLQLERMVRAALPAGGKLDEALRQAGATLEGTRAIEMTLLDGLTYAPVIRDLRTVLIRNETAVAFVTSDAPVVAHNQWMQAVGQQINVLGMAMSGLQFFLPLSSNYALALYDDAVYRLKGARGSVVPLCDPRCVLQLNGLQATLADACLYYSEHTAPSDVDSLPWNLRLPKRERSVLRDFYSSEAPHFTERVPFELTSRVRLSGLFSLRRHAEEVEMSARVRTRRAAAVPVADLLLGVRDDIPRTPEAQEIVDAVLRLRGWRREAR